MRLPHLLAAAFSFTALAAAPASANHWWSPYRWAVVDGSVPGALNVRVDAALTSGGGWSSYVATAITEWDVSTVLTLGSVHTSTASPKRCSPVTGRILVCDEFYGQRGWLGVATIWTDQKGRINQATTKLNDSYFSLATYNTPDWRKLVSCQEIGHDFGLAHQDENFSNPNLGTCMDYTNAPGGGGSYGPANTAPNQHDYDELVTIYGGQADGYTTATASSPATPTNFGIRDFAHPQSAPAAPAASAGSGDSPAEWGAPIHKDGKGRPDLFARTAANGGKMLTHVFWAPDTRAEDIH